MGKLTSTRTGPKIPRIAPAQPAPQPADQDTVVVPTRTRVSVHSSERLSGYEVLVSNFQVPDPDGPYLSSRIEGLPKQPETHLPVLDVDLPVDAVHTEHGYELRVTGPVSARLIARSVRRLARRGYTDKVWAREYSRKLRSFIGRRRRDAILDGATILVTVPVVSYPSKTAGHRHVYVEQVMSLRESIRFAEALGIVDVRHIDLARQEREWLVRVAP